MGLYLFVIIWEIVYLVFVIGKGRLFYKIILWVDFYISWDIINIWYDKFVDGKFLIYKYWVDN